MKNCFLQGYGDCGGKISGEHYISDNLLRQISSKGQVEIGGLPWQPTKRLQKIGIGSLVSNVLCETHNGGLSNLDSEAGKLFRALDAADKRPRELAGETTVDGALIERWLLKVMCGLTAAVGFNNGVVPDQWKKALTQGDWPNHWGVYIPTPSETRVLATEFSLETLTQNGTKTVKAVKFGVAGVQFNLLLGRPDQPDFWGAYHPRGLIFRINAGEKRVELNWPSVTNHAVIYTRIGSTKERPPQWRDWEEPT